MSPGLSPIFGKSLKVLITGWFKNIRDSQRELYSRREIERWAKNSHWQKLEIIETEENIVMFKAYYRDKKLHSFVHYERSVFGQQEGKWYYADGTIIE